MLTVAAAAAAWAYSPAPHGTDMFAATPDLAGLLFEFLRDSLAS